MQVQQTVVAAAWEVEQDALVAVATAEQLEAVVAVLAAVVAVLAAVVAVLAVEYMTVELQQQVVPLLLEVLPELLAAEQLELAEALVVELEERIEE